MCIRDRAKIEGLEDLLVGPTAVVLSSGDYLEPLKAVYEYAKNNETYKICLLYTSRCV